MWVLQERVRRQQHRRFSSGSGSSHCSLLSQVTSDRGRENSSGCARGALEWISELLMEREVRHWDGLPRAMMGSPSQRCLRNVALRDMGQ